VMVTDRSCLCWPQEGVWYALALPTTRPICCRFDYSPPPVSAMVPNHPAILQCCVMYTTLGIHNICSSGHAVVCDCVYNRICNRVYNRICNRVYNRCPLSVDVRFRISFAFRCRFECSITKYVLTKYVLTK